jgi:hypothetical protein
MFKIVQQLRLLVSVDVVMAADVKREKESGSWVKPAYFWGGFGDAYACTPAALDFHPSRPH